jgi:hypothetical protein
MQESIKALDIDEDNYKEPEWYYKLWWKLTDFPPINWLETQYYNLKYGITNLIIYFKVIWYDRNWDQYFLYVLLAKKLERMEIEMKEANNHTDTLEVVEQIKEAKEIIIRFRDGIHSDLAHEEYEKKWKRGEIYFVPYQNSKDFSEMKNTADDKLTKEQLKEKSDDLKEAFKKERILIDKDFKRFGKLFSKSLGWWD